MTDETSVAAAMDVLDRFMLAFNAHDPRQIAATFNFPHVRFHSGKVTVFDMAADFNLANFQATNDAKEWARSAWDDRRVITAGADKVHFDTRFSRLRAD
ncbi:MAG: hypothetical protein ACK5JT_01045, partial [Hyphomicrobiaceae bacterium]